MKKVIDDLCTFDVALSLVKNGNAIKRKDWADNEFAVYQKGYPDGINCNKQTAEAWGMNEGDLFKCSPYLQKQNKDGSHMMWTPNTDELLSSDWVVFKI